jgi:hypothetical protein
MHRKLERDKVQEEVRAGRGSLTNQSGVKEARGTEAEDRKRKIRLPGGRKGRLCSQWAIRKLSRKGRYT